MKAVVSFVVKLLLKTFIGLALAFLYVLNFILAICCVTLRYIALPVMFVAAVIAITTYSDHGLTRDVVECIGTFAMAGVFYFALPQIPKLIAFLQGFLTAAFHATPLMVKHSVKYTF